MSKDEGGEYPTSDVDGKFQSWVDHAFSGSSAEKMTIRRMGSDGCVNEEHDIMIGGGNGVHPKWNITAESVMNSKVTIQQLFDIMAENKAETTAFIPRRDDGSPVYGIFISTDSAMIEKINGVVEE